MDDDAREDDWDDGDRRGPQAGLAASTPVATATGWRNAGDLKAGDLILSFEAGPQPIRRLVQEIPRAMAPPLWPLWVPPWALDNREGLRLLPDQPVLIETDLAEVLYGDPFAVMPAEALEGWRGISRCAPLPGEPVVGLSFDAPQVIYASRSLLLPCPGLDRSGVEGGVLDISSDPVPYSPAQARHLIACLMAEELGGALRRVPPQAAFGVAGS